MKIKIRNLSYDKVATLPERKHHRPVNPNPILKQLILLLSKGELKNVEKLKEAIERLLDNSEYAEMLGARAKERVVAEYSIDSVWHKTIDIWRKV